MSEPIRRSIYDRLFFADDGEGGYTTLGMAVALLVSLSLVFAGAQAYRINTASAAIQDVADASALAAENQVGQYMVMVRVSDAVVLSLSLTSIAATGLGVAALCTPVTAEASTTLLNVGRKISQARDTFSRSATKVLDAIQKALPFLSAASAWSVARRNNDTFGGQSNYLALAILVPSTGTVEGLDADTATEEAQDAADEKADEIKENASEAEDAAREANAAKHKAFMADCGNNPGYCMYERASTLAGLAGSENPLYTQEEVWTFSVALDRARRYYAQRYRQEAPDGRSVEDQARSALRKNVYQYAIELMSEGYVYETEDSFNAYFPTLPRNTDEMRETSLYTDARYPVTVDEDGNSVMHAFVGCPQAAGYSSLASVSDMEQGDYQTCSECGFTASSLGSVCSASTSISNGFEYHYRIVAEAASEYEKSREELDESGSIVKEDAESLFDLLKKALNAAKEARIAAEPAGRYGVIVLVVDSSSAPVSEGLGSSFISTDATLGTRAAVSGATLLADASDDQNSVITQVLDSIRDQGGVATGVMSAVLTCWSYLLYAYGEGQDALSEGIKQAVNEIPFASESGLGKWAAKKFTKAVEETGLQAAELDALKPVLINTEYIAKEDGGGFSVRYLAVKKTSEATLGSDLLFSPLVDEAEATIISKLSGEIELATIEPLGDWGPSIPLTITLPPAAQEASQGVIEQVADQIRGVLPRVESENVWK